jgi:hypothetical protein
VLKPKNGGYALKPQSGHTSESSDGSGATVTSVIYGATTLLDPTGGPSDAVSISVTLIWEASGFSGTCSIAYLSFVMVYF